MIPMAYCLRTTALAGVLLLYLPLAATAAVHEVKVHDDFFSPSELTIQVGDTVRWTNAADYGNAHNVTSDTGAWVASTTAESFEFEVVFNSPGSFPYHCTIHRQDGMTGIITVEGEAPDEFVINAGLNDAWVNADAPFQGFFFTVFPDLSLFFASWFTFDSVIPDESASAVFGAPDQRWVTASGFYSGDSVTLNVELTTGGIFNASDPEAEQTPNYGTIAIKFLNCNEAEVTYDFPSLGLSGQMILTRVVGDNIPLCQALNAELQAMQ